MLRSLRTMLCMRPASSNSMIGSGRSKSIEPRSWRRRLSSSASSFMRRKFVDQRRVARGHFRIAFEHFVDVGVGHALGGANHAGGEIGADHFPGRVHFHDHAHHQAIDLRIERADAVGKLFGKHRHGAIREIDGGAAQARFAIERGIAPDVVRDVRDVHLQLEVAVRQRADVDGVVEIARGFAVDGDDGQIAEIAAPAQVRFRHLLLRGARLRRALRHRKRAAGDACG